MIHLMVRSLIPVALTPFKIFYCLAHPNLSAILATDQKSPLSHLRISYLILAE